MSTWLLFTATMAAQDGPRFPLPQDDPRPVVALEPARLPESAAASCATCHPNVVQEWAATAHALAWVDVHYQEAIQDRRRPGLCYGCHVPEPLLAEDGLAERATARSIDRHLGVSCESCHLGPDGSMFGPAGSHSTAHTSTRSDLLTPPGSNQLCTVCHATNIGPVVGIAKDFMESTKLGSDESCVSCHMRRVERPGATSGWIDEANGQVTSRVTRSHSLQTPRDPGFLASAFSLELTDTYHLEIRNLAGHRIPGIIGRRIEFQVDVVGASGEVVEESRVEFNSRKYLPIGSAAEVSWAANGSGIRVIGRHWDPRADDHPVIFLDQLFSRGD